MLKATTAEPIRISIDDTHVVDGLLDIPTATDAVCVLAHGAGAGMTHPFMSAVAAGLVARGIAVLRYQFPYMQAGSRRPDRPALAQATVRAAVEAAHAHAPGLSLFAGGKSFGGRMTSQAEAARLLPDVAGLVFLGFPLHAAGQPAVTRGAHLRRIDRPMLFLQGTRDALADLKLLAPLVSSLGSHADLKVIEGGDHSFHVLVRSGRTDAEVLDEILDATAVWIARLARSPR